MRALYFTDPHLSDGRPGNLVRQKPFREEIFAKIRWLIGRAQEEEVDCILCGGDWFHRPHPSYGLFMEMRDLIRGSDLKWVGIAGNHDLPYNRFEHSKEAALGLLSEDIDLIGQDVRQVDGVDIFGSSYGFPWSVEGLIGELNLVHDMITPGPFYGPHLDLSAKIVYNKGERRAVLCSHYHRPFEVWIGDLVFLNPGSLSRLSIDDLKHQPQILWIDTEIWDFQFEAVPLSSVRVKEENLERVKLDTRAFEGIQFGQLDIEEFLVGLDREVAVSVEHYLERAQEIRNG